MPSPNSWSRTIANIAITILVVAIALHLATVLIRSVAPELFALFFLIAIGYGIRALARARRSRW